MYQPPHFVEDRLAVRHMLIRAHSLGLLITADPAGLRGGGQEAESMTAAVAARGRNGG